MLNSLLSFPPLSVLDKINLNNLDDLNLMHPFYLIDFSFINNMFIVLGLFCLIGSIFLSFDFFKNKKNKFNNLTNKYNNELIMTFDLKNKEMNK